LFNKASQNLHLHKKTILKAPNKTHVHPHTQLHSIKIATDLSLIPPKWIFFFMRKEKLSFNRHHPYVCAHSSAQLISYMFTVVTIHCDRLRLEQFSIGHSHERRDIFSDFIWHLFRHSIASENGWKWRRWPIQVLFISLPPTHSPFSFTYHHLNGMLCTHTALFNMKLED
jgi:hypothetical protein